MDFYKQHRWPRESSVLLLTVERCWIACKRRALAAYIHHAASFQVPESIWTIQTLPESPNTVAVATPLSACGFFSYHLLPWWFCMAVHVYGNLSAVRLQIWMDVLRTAHCGSDATFNGQNLLRYAPRPVLSHGFLCSEQITALDQHFFNLCYVE